MLAVLAGFLVATGEEPPGRDTFHQSPFLAHNLFACCCRREWNGGLHCVPVSGGVVEGGAVVLDQGES